MLPLAQSPSLPGGDAAALHLVSVPAKVHRLPVDALRGQGPMIHPGRMTSCRQGLVHRFGPTLPPPFQDRRPIPLPGLQSKRLAFQNAESQHDVRVGVPRIGMDHQVGHHSLGHTLPVHPRLEQLNTILKAQLLGQCQLELPGKLRVLPPFEGFDPVPQGRAIQHPRWSTHWRQHPLVDHRPAAAVVPGQPEPGIGQGAARPIGR